MDPIVITLLFTSIIAVFGLFYGAVSLKKASQEINRIQESLSENSKLPTQYETYWREHCENIAIAILRIFGKNISNGPVKYKNAVMFNEPLILDQNDKPATRQIKIYGMAYDPEMDFGNKSDILQDDVTQDVKKSDSSNKPVSENVRVFLEWYNGTALLKGAHFGLRLINSVDGFESESEYGLTHLSDGNICRILRHLVKEVTGEEINIITPEESPDNNSKF